MENQNKNTISASNLADLDAYMEYEGVILSFLASKLTEDEKGIFLDIALKDDDPIGYRKTQVPDFPKKRRKYEIAWGKLEAQGFIRVEEIGNMRICRLTVRGKQLEKYLKQEI